MINSDLQLSDFDYSLPRELIAQKPMNPRDHSRLLVLDKFSGKIEHKHFYDIVGYLKKGDVMVLNNSKVFPARLIGKKVPHGGRIEVFLLQKMEALIASKRLLKQCAMWRCLLGGRGAREGLEVEFEEGLKCKVVKNNNDGTWEAEFSMDEKKMMEVVEKIGKVPLPPYVKRLENTKQAKDNRNYQTTYADKNKIGSVAAPTAGLHFTPALIKKLKDKGVQLEYVTLHVGLGTFAPVKEHDITEHKMHSECVEIEEEAVERIAKAKNEGRRIIAVGTTSVRTLESIFFELLREQGIENKLSTRKEEIKNLDIEKLFKNLKLKIKNSNTSIKKFSLNYDPVRKNIFGMTNIFIYPGYKFKVIDGMITNFHLPKSTLLMLVSAFAGKKNIDKAYKEAIKKKYRFYSYGDAMLIL